MKELTILSILIIIFTGCTNKQDPIYKQYSAMSCSEIEKEHRKGFLYLQNKGKTDLEEHPISHNIKEGINLFTGGELWSDKERQIIHEGQILSYIAREKKCNYKL